MAEAEEARQALSRQLRLLEEGGRAARLEALAGLGAALEALPPPLLQEVFARELLRPLTRCLVADPAERCRELALGLARLGLRRGARPAAALPLLLPALAQRLGGPGPGPGPGPGGEACEELRLGLLQLLRALLAGCEGHALAPFLPELLRVLRAALRDPFPEAKLEGAAAAAAVARALPGAWPARLGGRPLAPGGPWEAGSSRGAPGPAYSLETA